MHRKEIQVFSIAFLDVFCCSLGAILLIFIINSQIMTRHVKGAVSRYRDEAQSARLARDAAERAELDARRSREQSLRDGEEALAQKRLAEAAAQKSRQSEMQALAAKELALSSEQTSQRMNSQLLQSRNDLERTNQALQETLAQSRLSDEKLAGLMTQYGNMQKAYTRMQNEQADLLSAIERLRQEKEQLQSRHSQLETDYAREQTDRNHTQTQYQKELERIRLLTQRLQKKEEHILALERDLQAKGEKALFGIALRYQRIVFLFDKSGSIKDNGWQKTIIGTCAEILQHCQVDEFAIIAFSSGMQYFPGQKGLMLPGSDENKQKALQWLNQTVVFDGATHIHRALPSAYQDYGKLDAIFLLTDGMPSEVGYHVTELEETIVKYITARVHEKISTRIITVAIGYPGRAGEYADIYNYLHKISEITGGQYLGR